MLPYVVELRNTDRLTPALVGGKAANLGRLTTMESILVPDGFCVTTEAFTVMLDGVPGFDRLLDALGEIGVQDRVTIADISAAIRAAILSQPVPPAIVAAVTAYLEKYGADRAYAVRSSATAEDLPTASFAGQQDSYLQIVGIDAVLQSIRACWASLYTERAVSYRQQQGFDHRLVKLAVVVQHMLTPQAAGVLFTADPVSGHRKVSTIDASFGVGEALVGGLVNPDHYTVREGVIQSKQVGYRPVDTATTGADLPAQYLLTDEQVLQLVATGRRIEQYFGSPQDIEWCLVDGVFHIVQSRPITTLFPIPEVADDNMHVYISVGHQQMMTDAMRPLGLSFFLMMGPPTMRTAGGRLFVDVATMLVSPASRAAILNSVGKSDPLIKDALETVLKRDDIVPAAPVDQPAGIAPRVATLSSAEAPVSMDPSVVDELIREGQASVAELKEAIQGLSGTGLLAFIAADMLRLKAYIQGPTCLPAILASMNAAVWINERLHEWLGEANAADTLAQSVPDNITSAMGLALLDVGDVVRPYPGIVAFLQNVQQEDFLEDLLALEGGKLVYDAIHAFLEKYGMRCTGEIDITRPRWRETPSALIPLIVGNVYNQLPGASRRKFEQGLEAAMQHKQALLSRLLALPGGEQKAADTERMIDQLRHFAGYREYPKYFIVSRYDLYKQALLREAVQWVQDGRLRTPEDIYWLRFEELQAGHFDQGLIDQRRAQFPVFEKLQPPRVMTSDGEIIRGAYQHVDLPAGALAGLAVSAGIVEGRARVITDLSAADLQEGDILVTTFTDPSWTPLFVSIRGLVTEVGGLMTHGAVIAREYGLPAVVGVEHATRLIIDGQRIRVHGTAGYVEVV